MQLLLESEHFFRLVLHTAILSLDLSFEPGLYFLVLINIHIFLSDSSVQRFDGRVQLSDLAVKHCNLISQIGNFTFQAHNIFEALLILSLRFF